MLAGEVALQSRDTQLCRAGPKVKKKKKKKSTVAAEEAADHES